MNVRAIMTRNVVSCMKDADVATAAKLMWEGRFGMLPVMDTHGAVVGILTDRDIAMAVATRRRHATHISVHEAMTQKVRSCFVDDEIGTALKQMEDGQVRRLPVLDSALHLVGILSIDDIVLKALDRDAVTSGEFVAALQRICSLPSREPDVDFSDNFVSG